MSLTLYEQKELSIQDIRKLIQELEEGLSYYESIPRGSFFYSHVSNLMRTEDKLQEVIRELQL